MRAGCRKGLFAPRATGNAINKIIEDFLDDLPAEGSNSSLSRAPTGKVVIPFFSLSHDDLPLPPFRPRGVSS